MGEFDLIRRHFAQVARRLQPDQPVEMGIGDDAAVFNVPAGHQLVCCVDTLVAGRHFPLDTPAHAIGWKSVAVNLSDLAAMGARPHSILLALSLPSADDDWLCQFSQGLFECCQRYGVQLIGGDTTASPTLTITVTALGWIPSDQAILRQAAQVGDLICVTGEMGNAAYALQHPGSALQATLDYPHPQVSLGQQLRDYASSMIDISDGLGQDLGHILSASNVGAVIDLAKIPTHPLLQALPNPGKWHYQLNGGDDYQLCFTLSPDKFNTFMQRYAPPVSVIGEIVDGQDLILLDRDQSVPFNIQGWQHF